MKKPADESAGYFIQLCYFINSAEIEGQFC